MESITVELLKTPTCFYRLSVATLKTEQCLPPMNLYVNKLMDY